MHTSTVTVAVIDTNISVNPKYQLRDKEHFYVEWFSGSGAGGQHRNKHQNCCRLYHLPTGLVETRQGRSRDSNHREAMSALIQRLDAGESKEIATDVSQDRKAQVGCGARGDKSITIRFQDDVAVNHLTEKKMSAKKYMKGFMDEIWIT